MRPTYFSLLFLLIAMAVDVFPQCPPPDTTVFGSGIVHHITIPSTTDQGCWVSDCAFTPAARYYVDVVVPDSVNTIEFGTEVSVTSHIGIKVNGCKFSVLDSCGQWWATDATYLVCSLATGKNFRMNLEMDISSAPGFYIKVTPCTVIPTTVYRPCGLVGVPEPSAGNTPSWEYYRWDTGRREYPPLRAGYYIQRETLSNSRRILRVIRE